LLGRLTVGRGLTGGQHPWQREIELRLYLDDFRAGQTPAPKLSAADLEQCWTALAGDDRRSAYEATGRLIAGGEQAAAFLRARLRTMEKMDSARAAQLLADLDAPQFAVRDAATRAWRKTGAAAEPVLRDALLKGKLSLEACRRVQDLLADFNGFGPDCRRLLRILDALEHIEAPSATEVLESLSRDAPATWLACEAQLALQRVQLRAMGESGR